MKKFKNFKEFKNYCATLEPHRPTGDGVYCIGHIVSRAKVYGNAIYYQTGQILSCLRMQHMTLP